MKQFFQQLQPSKLWKSDRAKCLAACIVHLPSLITTIALISLNFSFKWYSDADIPNQNAQLNALQFASKIHEIVIITSLSVVAVSCVQHELCRRDGLAIGGVLAAFQISNIMSLFSPALWRTCVATGFASGRILFGLMITLLTLLGAIVGPSSAILMLPSLGSWDLNVPLTWYQGRIQEADIYLAGNEHTIWPSAITTSNFLPSECMMLNASTVLENHCAAAGLPILLTRPSQSSLYYESSRSNITSSQITWNFSMPEKQSVLSSSYQYTRGVQGSRMLANNFTLLTQSTAVSMNHAIMSLFLKARLSSTGRNALEWKDDVTWRFSLGNRSRTLAPQTFVICQTEVLHLDPSTGSVAAGQRLAFPLRGQRYWSADVALLTERWNSTTQMASRWVTPPELFNNTPSISFALIGYMDPELHYWNDTASSYFTHVGPEAVTCSIYASWHPVDMNFSPGMPFRISSSAIDDGPKYYKTKRSDLEFPAEAWRLSNLTEPGTRDIHLSAEWANLALPPELTIEKLILYNGQNLSGPREGSTRAALAFIVTDALARFGYSTEVVIASPHLPKPNELAPELAFVVDPSTLDMSNLTPIRVTRDRYGYSYSTSGTTRRLAIIVVFIHILIAMIHTILVVWYKWWCPGLQSLGDLFVLAVNSSKAGSLGEATSELDPSSKKNEYTIQVCEVGDEKLEMEISGKKGTVSETSADKERPKKSGRSREMMIMEHGVGSGVAR